MAQGQADLLIFGAVGTFVTGFFTFVTLLVKTYTDNRQHNWDVKAKAAKDEVDRLERVALNQAQADAANKLHDSISKNVELASQAVMQAKSAYDEANTVNNKIAKLNAVIMDQGNILIKLSTQFNTLIGNPSMVHGVQGMTVGEAAATPIHDALKAELDTALVNPVANSK